MNLKDERPKTKKTEHRLQDSPLNLIEKSFPELEHQTENKLKTTEPINESSTNLLIRHNKE